MQVAVPMTDTGGKSTVLTWLSRMKDMVRPYGLSDVLPIPVDKLMVSEWVRLKCEYGCGKYATNWCCPPATPDPERVRRILKGYSSALLLIGRQEAPCFYRGDAKTRLMRIKYWKGTLSLERQLFLEGYYKAFALVGETCMLCKECSYPSGCKFPQERRPTVESFSIDILGTVEGLGIQPKIAKDLKEAYSYFSLILLQ